MKIIDFNNFKPLNQEAIVTIGNFDGVHLGHKTILTTLISESKKEKTLAVVVVFKNLIKTSLNILTHEEKLNQLAKYDIDVIIELDFDKVKLMSPGDFLENLNKLVKIKHFVIGSDFHFGKAKKGNSIFLKNLYKKTIIVQRVNNISSSLIKELLQQGDIKEANRLLGYNYVVSGKVVYGDKIASNYGIPTANVNICNEKSPIHYGVYFAYVLMEKKLYPSLAIFNNNPTREIDKKIFEVHILNFKKEIYGKEIKIQFLDKIRNLIKFDNIDEVFEQAKKDKRKCIDYFNKF